MSVVVSAALIVSFLCVSSSRLHPKIWQDRINNNELIYSSTNPSNGYYPNIGNGFIGCNVGCYPNVKPSEMNNIANQLGKTPHGSLYIAGVYNGNLSEYIGNGDYKTSSHRAQIPGINSFYIKTFERDYNITWKGAVIDLANGTVSNQSHIQHPIKCPNGVDIQITQYTHRHFRSLLVFNISLINVNQQTDIYCEVPLAHCNLDKTLDFKWYEINSTIIPNTKLRGLQTLVAETINSTLIDVGIAYQKIPNTIIFNTTNKKTETFITYYSVFHNSLPVDSNITINNNSQTELIKICENELNAYINSYTSSEIYDYHQKRMSEIWNRRIEFVGNDTITKGIYASYYYLLNGLRNDYPFTTSPGGLSTNDYFGHAFWDAETWMFRTIAIVDPSIASIMLQYRLNRIYAAQQYVIENGYTSFIGFCAQFPWESAYTGTNVCPQTQKYGNKEQHIIADIGLAIKFLYLSTMNETWFFNSTSTPPLTINYEQESKYKYNYFHLLNQSCNFFMNRFNKVVINDTYYYYTIYNVIPPDEKAGVVNSSIYTNAAAALLIEFCLDLSNKYNLYIPTSFKLLWEDIINNTYLPMSDKLRESDGELLHLEYEKYRGESVNQADVALLQYPLLYFNTDKNDEYFINYNKTILMNDLIYYEKKTGKDFSDPFFTGDSSYSIAWLKLLNIDKAQKFFDAAFEHMDINHFYVFREKDAGDGGNLNFLTGIGGLLQNTIFGYGGAIITKKYLYFNPVFPLLTASNITYIKFHNLVFRGIAFSFSFQFDINKNNSNDMVFELKSTQSLQIELLKPNYDDNTIIVEKVLILSTINNPLTVSSIQLCRLSILN